MKSIAICCSAVLLAFTAGCATVGDDTESEPTGQLQQASTEVTVHLYGFRGGQWQLKDYSLSGVQLGQPYSFAFGVSSDVPLVVGHNWPGGGQVGTYGTAGPRLGYFYFDENISLSWNAGDSATKFMAAPELNDKPLVVFGQLWAKNASGNCEARWEPCSGGGTGCLNFELLGRQVGVKRGTTVYLDRDGDGVWGGPNSCDLSGEFGFSSDKPFGTSHVGTARGGGAGWSWYFDNNDDLLWSSPPDSISTNFGLSSDYFPPALHSGLAVQRGRDVGFDSDPNHVWSSNDLWLTNALPGSDWRLAGVTKETQVY